MRISSRNRRIAFAFSLLFGSGTAVAALPAQTPEQQQAAAIKKAQAAEQATKEKQQLSESMDKISERWRARAAKEGWKTNPATPVAVQPGAPVAGAAPVVSGQVGQAGQAAQAGQAGAQTAPGTATAPAGAPLTAPIRSEKLGTAPPSADVKTNEASGTRLNERIYKNPVEEPPHKKPAK